MRDQQGVDTSCNNTNSLDIYANAVRAFNTYRGDPAAVVDQAIQSDPEFAMGHVLRGYVNLSMWERSVVSEVADCAAKVKSLNGTNDREQRHAHTLEQWASGDWDGARQSLDTICADYPRDLLALQIGHLSDFYHGDRENLRGRIARALPAWSTDAVGYSFLYGMHAFGLEECGDYEKAEESGRKALELAPEDCWAQHAVAHVMEMQGRQEEGIEFMESRKEDWAQEDNGFQFHNWWHTALYNLDSGNTERALEIYDQGVRPEPEKIQLMMLDAAALLWRMHLRKLDVGNRWQELADVYANDNEEGFYAFNDMHAMMAFAATGNDRAAEARIAAMRASLKQDSTNAMMAATVGLPIAYSIQAFANQRYDEAVERLMPVRYKANIFGGSHAQRDIVHRTLIEASIRAGNKTLAQALTNERLSLKPHCPFSVQLGRRATKH